MLFRSELGALAGPLHDRMTEAVMTDARGAEALFAAHAPRPLGHVALGGDPAAALLRANRDMGLALSGDEIEYLAAAYARLGRDPTDVELMMFAQANSEHCRHKIFNADWIVDGERQPKSLFAMIRNTHRCAPRGLWSRRRGVCAETFIASIRRFVSRSK